MYNSIIGMAVFLIAVNAPGALDKSSLIFPDQNEKIILLQAAGRSENLLQGEICDPDSPLVKKISKELALPFHASLLKMNQCSRNFSDNNKGPNVLFLSRSEGGFPRHGLVIKQGESLEKLPNLNYVDLVLNEQRVEQGALDIYSHELGHVMMMNIWPDFPQGRSRLQHVSMGVTDFCTAFFEGWGIHFQRLVYEGIPRYRDTYQSGLSYSRSTGRLWHSAMDKELRLDAVLKNEYIHKKQVPEVDLAAKSAEELILLEHTSPLFDRTRLKNAQQMLACEGVIATLFYRINTNPKLQENFREPAFYEHFLLSPFPEDKKPEDIFTPFENVILKNFWVWSRIKGEITSESVIFIEFLNKWIQAFPQDREELTKLFLLTTAGSSVSDTMPRLYEQMAVAGMIGNIQEFRSLFSEYSQTFKELLPQLLDDNSTLDTRIGPELWLENKDVLIRAVLWNPEPKHPLFINLNTTSEYALAAIPGISIEQARRIIKIREDKVFFNSRDELKIYNLY